MFHFFLLKPRVKTSRHSWKGQLKQLDLKALYIYVHVHLHFRMCACVYFVVFILLNSWNLIESFDLVMHACIGRNCSLNSVAFSSHLLMRNDSIFHSVKLQTGISPRSLEPGVNSSGIVEHRLPRVRQNKRSSCPPVNLNITTNLGNVISVLRVCSLM